MKLPHLDTPQYPHTCGCGACVWLGRHELYDLYACRHPLPRGVVLVARFGDGLSEVVTFALGMYRGRAEELGWPFCVAWARAAQAGIV